MAQVMASPCRACGGERPMNETHYCRGPRPEILVTCAGCGQLRSLDVSHDCPKNERVQIRFTPWRALPLEIKQEDGAVLQTGVDAAKAFIPYDLLYDAVTHPWSWVEGGL